MVSMFLLASGAFDDRHKDRRSSSELSSRSTEASESWRGLSGSTVEASTGLMGSSPSGTGASILIRICKHVRTLRVDVEGRDFAATTTFCLVDGSSSLELTERVGAGSLGEGGFFFFHLTCCHSNSCSREPSTLARIGLRR